MRTNCALRNERNRNKWNQIVRRDKQSFEPNSYYNVQFSDRDVSE